MWVKETVNKNEYKVFIRILSSGFFNCLFKVFKTLLSEEENILLWFMIGIELFINSWEIDLSIQKTIVKKRYIFVINCVERSDSR